MVFETETSERGDAGGESLESCVALLGRGGGAGRVAGAGSGAGTRLASASGAECPRLFAAPFGVVVSQV